MNKKYIDKIKDGNNNVYYDLVSSEIREAESSGVEFGFSDEHGNLVVEFNNGNVKTKNFDSAHLPLSEDSESYDFAVVDSNVNEVFRVKKGLLESRNTPSTRLHITIEGGAIDGSGIDVSTYDSYKNFCRSGFFIDIADSECFKPSIDCNLSEYDANHQFINKKPLSADKIYGFTEGCKYIRFAFPKSVDADMYCDFYGSRNVCETKKVAMRTPSERLVFHVDGEMFTAALLMLPPNYTANGKKVPLVIWDSGDGSYTNWNTYEMGTGYERRRIGLEYMRDQGFAVIEIYSWGSYYYKKYPGCGSRSAMPIPTHLKTHEKGVEYVCSRYNIDADNIFHLSKSGSGKIALGYALKNPKFTLKHIYAFAPVFDDLNFLNIGMRDYRRALMEELELQGTQEELDTFYNGNSVAEGSKTGQGWVFGYNKNYTDLQPDDPILQATISANRAFIAKNSEKFVFMSVNWINLIGQTISEKIQDTYNFGRTFWDAAAQGQQGSEATGEACYTRHDLTMIGSGIPIKVIMATNDEQTPYWNCAEVVSQLKNGGVDATIYTLESQGHSAPDMGTVEQATDITTMCGQHYDAVSVGWYMACQDIQKRYLSHIDEDVYNYIYSTT